MRAPPRRSSDLSDGGKGSQSGQLPSLSGSGTKKQQAQAAALRRKKAAAESQDDKQANGVGPLWDEQELGLAVEDSKVCLSAGALDAA